MNLTIYLIPVFFLSNLFFGFPSQKNKSFEIAESIENRNTTLDLKKKKLLWAEEFNYKGAPDSKKWTHEIGNGQDGWGNREKQFYTNRPENSWVDKGTLKIKLMKEDYKGFPYTSARMITKGKFEVKYGRVEIRAKVPQGKGTWPAGWMLGSNINQVGWPKCGEIDILEHVGKDLNTIYGTLHFPEHAGGNAVTKTLMVPTATSKFHVYAVDWTKDKIEFSVDGKVYHHFTNTPDTPFHDPQFIILNMAMGGNFGGEIDPNINEALYEVDYVRVYTGG